WTCSFMAARASSVNPLPALRVTAALFLGFCVSAFGLIDPPHTDCSQVPPVPRRISGESMRPPLRGFPLLRVDALREEPEHQRETGDHKRHELKRGRIPRCEDEGERLRDKAEAADRQRHAKPFGQIAGSI